MGIISNGPLFIGSIFNWALFGTETIQLYMYHRAGFKDAAWIRGFVGASYTLDLLQTVFATHCVWYLLVLHWGDGAVFAAAPWTAATFPITAGLSAVITQVFFAWRIWTLKPHWLARSVAVLIFLVGLMQCLSGIVFGVRSSFTSTLELATIRSGCIVWLAGAAACDILIVGAMLFILHSAKTLPAFESTINLIDRLMIQTVHSGAVTAVAAIIELVLFLVFPDNFLYSAIVLFLGKLYTNVLLANLNGRRRHDRSYDAYTDATNTLTRRINTSARISARVDGNTLPYATNHSTNNIEVKMFREVHVEERKSSSSIIS